MGPGKYDVAKNLEYIRPKMVNPPVNKEKKCTFTMDAQKKSAWVPGPGHHYKDKDGSKHGAGHDVQKLIVKSPPTLRMRRHW